MLSWVEHEKSFITLAPDEPGFIHLSKTLKIQISYKQYILGRSVVQYKLGSSVVQYNLRSSVVHKNIQHDLWPNVSRFQKLYCKKNNYIHYMYMHL